MGFPDVNELIGKLDAATEKPDEANFKADSGPESSQAAASQEGAPEAKEAASPSGEKTQEQRILDLAEIIKDNGKFKWEGQEWTLQDLKKAAMRNEDYTRKTQEISAQRKEYESVLPHKQFWENLEGDIAKVAQNPQLIAEFKKIYPDSFHKYVTAFDGDTGADVSRTLKQVLEREITPLKAEMDAWRESQQEAKTNTLVAQMQSWDSDLKSKYPEADERHVYALISEAKGQGTPISKELWQQAWKSSHDQLDKRINERAKTRLRDTKQNNAAAKDIPAGGTTPGQAPTKVPFSKSAEYLEKMLTQQQQ